MDFWRRGRRGGDTHREFLSSWVSKPELVPSRHSPKWAPAAPRILPHPADVSRHSQEEVRGSGQWEPAGDRGWQGRSEGHFSFWTSFKNFPPHLHPLQTGFAVLPRRGHLDLLSHHQAPDTVLNGAKCSSYIFSVNPCRHPL